MSQTETFMRIRSLAPATLLAVAATTSACSTDRVLDVTQPTVASAATAVSDPQSAAAAVSGMYSSLLSTSYYGGTFQIVGDLSSDNVQHTGTFGSYRQLDQNNVLADNGDVAAMWRLIYQGINNANNVLQQMPAATYLAANTRSQYIGEAFFLRALGHHNATRFWGAVPVVLKPVNGPAEAGAATRADTTTVYRQILADLDSAERYMNVQKGGRQGTVGAARALRARVLLYRGDWTGALAAAQAVTALGYQLAPTYADLFSAAGSNTSEDIFRLRFDNVQTNVQSYYYFAKANGGRYEVAPTAELQSQYGAGDSRATWNFLRAANGQLYGGKYRSVTGTEHLHVIRYAEVLLLQAEALARLGRLGEAVVPLNAVRARAGAAPFALAAGATQQEVIAAIIRERRLELAMEGDRWADMIRTGLAQPFLTAKSAAVTQALFPIPQRDRDVAPGLTQNAGY